MIIELKTEKEFTEIVSSGITLVDFNATWCGACRMLKPEFEEASNELPQIKFLGVDVDQFPAIAGQFNIRAVPTLVLIKDGKIVNIKSGYMPKDSLVSLAKSAL